MADDKKQGSGGFDDWLDEEDGPATDPYSALSQDDPDGEITDWVAYSEGRVETPEQEVARETDASNPDAGSTDSDEHHEPDTGELEIVTPDAVDEAMPTSDVEDETSEIEVADVGSFAGGADADSDMRKLQDEEVTQEVAVPYTVVEFAQDEDDEARDTGELDVASIASGGLEPDTVSNDFGDIWDQDSPSSGAGPSLVTETDADDLSKEGYLANATREHTDLAEAIAIAEEQDTAQVAVASAIPGLAESVVGFEDVVEAEGLGRTRARASSDLVSRVITAIVLILAFAASLVWQPVFVAFATAVFVIGAGEFYTSLMRSDRKPIALFGFIGIVGAALGAFLWGALAIPVAFFVAVTLLLLFYAVTPGKADPMGNLALTITVMVWVGLGVFAMLIADSESYRPLVIAVVVIVAAMDISQYFIGRTLGRTPLAPWVSPNKTVEGLVGGIVVALGAGAGLHFVQPFELTSGLALGLVVAILAPLGDLAMSAAKRSLGLKDMGSVLPGHGGFLDRIDGLLFVIPAAWLVFMWAGLL